MLLYTLLQIFAVHYCGCLKCHTDITFYDDQSILQYNWDELNFLICYLSKNNNFEQYTRMETPRFRFYIIHLFQLISVNFY